MSDPSADAASLPTATPEAQLRAQLQAEPTHHGAALALADLLLHDGRVDDAIALLAEHAGDRDCGDLLREYLVGERMNGEAQQLLAQRGSDASASGLVDKAIASHLLGDLEGALSYCRLAIAADSNYAPAHNHQGRALFNARRAVPARAALVHAVRIAPNYAEAWHNLAHALRDANEVQQAERAYGHALRLRPAYRSARLNLGIVQMALRRPDDALGNFRSLLAIDPTHAEGCFNLAVCEHLLRRYDDARTSYARALVLDPRNPRVSLQLGRLCNELHDSEGALQQFRRALDLNPRDPEAWSEIAMVHDQADHPEEAERAIAAGLAAAPGDASLRLEQANLARRRGDYDVALAGLRAIDPQMLHPRLRPRYEKSLELTLARLG
jgi:tetratricopeptide (TPR) repeat protein